MYKTITCASEIGKLREGVAVLRIMQAHGINHIAIHGADGKLIECTSVGRMIEDAKKSE